MRLIRWAPVLAAVALLPFFAAAEEEAPKPVIIQPAYEIRADVQKLIAIAQEEVGYAEAGDGSTKYGQWAGDPQAEWCAEFLCWAVDQADKATGGRMLDVLYPNYGANNTGRLVYSPGPLHRSARHGARLGQPVAMRGAGDAPGS